jgi:hypothetical protein
MTRRRWWTVAAVIVLAASVAAVFMWILPDRSTSDCEVVHQLVDYNQKHNEAIRAQSDPNGVTEASMSDYTAWASRLRAYAESIRDPGLSSRANHVAALADQTVTIVGQAREVDTQVPTSSPPPWVRRYADLNAMFKTEISAMARACSA